MSNHRIFDERAGADWSTYVRRIMQNGDTDDGRHASMTVLVRDADNASAEAIAALFSARGKSLEEGLAPVTVAFKIRVRQPAQILDVVRVRAGVIEVGNGASIHVGFKIEARRGTGTTAVIPIAHGIATMATTQNGKPFRHALGAERIHLASLPRKVLEWDMSGASLALSRRVQVPDLNHYGKLFGGVTLETMNLAAIIHAGDVLAAEIERGAAQEPPVDSRFVAAFQEVAFPAPGESGDMMYCYAKVMAVGQSSLAVQLELKVRRHGKEIVIARGRVIPCLVDGSWKKIPHGISGLPQAG